MKLIRTVKKKDYEIGFSQYSYTMVNWKREFTRKFEDLKNKIKTRKVAFEDVNDALIEIGYLKREFESLAKLFKENESIIDNEWKKMV